MRHSLRFALLLAALVAMPLVAASSPATDDGHASATGEQAHDESHGASHGPPIIAKVVNTLIFFGLLGWFGGPWIAARFRTRKAQIASDLGAAKKAREEAEAKLGEIEARLVEVDAEVETILGKAGQQASAEKERIVAAATLEAERILSQAEAQVGELEVQASHRLRVQAADLAVELARGLVTQELADADRAKLFDDYLHGLEKAAG